jgi:hypothetical protein
METDLAYLCAFIWRKARIEGFFLASNCVKERALTSQQRYFGTIWMVYARVLILVSKLAKF